MILRIPLRIVFYKEADSWLAHCLEFDLIGDGETKETALGMLSEAIELQIRESSTHQNPANLFSPADGQYFRMFAAGKDIAKGELSLPIHEPGVDVSGWESREYDPDADRAIDSGCVPA